MAAFLAAIWRRVPTAKLLLAVGIALIGTGLFAPAPESRISTPKTRLDQLMPAWQFREFHTIRIAAPAQRVYESIRNVRADEIALFGALTWIRRGGRPLPESILNAGDRDPLIDVAVRGGFVRLADDAPRELVIYPGSALIRRMWLRAVGRRALRPDSAGTAAAGRGL